MSLVNISQLCLSSRQIPQNSVDESSALAIGTCRDDDGFFADFEVTIEAMSVSWN